MFIFKYFLFYKINSYLINRNATSSRYDIQSPDFNAGNAIFNDNRMAIF